MTMIPQCKGKDYTNLPKTLCYDHSLAEWSYATKYDGHYIQIHKVGANVQFYTSNGKPFYISNIADYLVKHNPTDFVLECEYIADTDGSLGSRTKCSTATFRANYSKGIETNTDHTFMVFNLISGSIEVLPPQLKLVEWSALTSLANCKLQASNLISAGMEGCMAKHVSHRYCSGKRVNTLIKLKHRPTADLLCVGTTSGEGEFTGGIGALHLKDENGVEVYVSSGLSLEQRFVDPSTYIGKIVEIQYEQILDSYIQPVFIDIRYDK